MFDLPRKILRRPIVSAVLSEPQSEIPSSCPCCIVQRIRHYDSSLEINQSVYYEREFYISDHEAAVLRDFIDENRRRRIVCNYYDR